MDTMGLKLSSIALIGAAAALAAVIFKEKESRIRDVIEMNKFSQAEIEASPQLNIANNDINTYLTGIQDIQLHKIILDIMKQYNKPIGYFSSLDGLLTLELPYYITIKKTKKWNERFTRKENFLWYIWYFLIFIGLTCTAINYEGHENILIKAISVGFSAAAGITLYYWFYTMKFKQKQHVTPEKLKEYEDVFEDYTMKKRSESIMKKDSITRK